MEQLGCCNMPWVSNQTLIPYIKAFWLGEDGLLEVFGVFLTDFFFPWARSLHESPITGGSCTGEGREIL